MKTFIYTSIALFLVACSQPIPKGNETANKSVKSETAELTSSGVLINPRDSFIILNSRDTVLKTSKMSRIHVPKSAFEHLDGKKPGNKVRIEFREYQTSGEIMASGLPMKYKDDKGAEIDFESAGMFEIRAYEGKEELRLKKDKEVKVELATPTDGMYNFYQLNDNTRAWKEEETNLKPIRNPYILQTQDSIKALAEATEKPRKLVQTKPTDKLIDIKLNVGKYSEFAELGPVMWKYMGTDTKSDPTKNDKFFSTNYEFISISPAESNEMIFDVQFASKKDTISLPMAPIYTGKLKARGERYFADKLKKFNESLMAQEALRKQNRNESNLLRVMKLDKLGIYNYDRQLKGYNIPILASFSFEGKKHADNPNMHVYLIPKGKAALIKYELATAEKFAFNPSEENVLIAIDADNVVYALSDAEIRKLNLPRFKGKKFEIQLHRNDQKVKTAQEMDQFIAAL